MAMTEKERRILEEQFEKQNKKILEAYRLTGDKSVLEMLHFNTDNADKLSRKFGITVKDAEELIKKQNEQKQSGKNPFDTIEEATKRLARVNEWISTFMGKGEKSGRYDEAFDFVAESGSEDPAALAEHLGTTEDEAAALIQEMKDRGDIGMDEEDSDEDETCGEEDEDDEYSEDGGTARHDPLCSLTEMLCFVGEVVSDTSEKICEALDEAADRITDADFDFDFGD